MSSDKSGGIGVATMSTHYFDVVSLRQGGEGASTVWQRRTLKKGLGDDHFHRSRIFGKSSWLGMLLRLQTSVVPTRPYALYISLFSLFFEILFSSFLFIFSLMRGARILFVGGRCYDLPSG
jgi:hypothetical protein